MKTERKSWKKLNVIVYSAFAIVLAVIFSSSILGSTFAKFISRLETNSHIQAAGFYITAGTLSQEQTVANENIMIAPGETKTVYSTINYFSQVNTKVTVGNDSITLTGALSNLDVSDLSDYDSWLLNHQYYPIITAPTSLEDMFTISVSSGIYSAPGSTVAEQVAEVIRQAGHLDGAGAYIAAMPADATGAVQIMQEITVTWHEISDAWDTYIGELIAQAQIESNGTITSGISLSLGVTVEQYLGTMPAVSNLTSTRWTLNNSIDISRLESDVTYDVVFTSNDQNYTGIRKSASGLQYISGDNVTTVWDGSDWENSEYKTITFSTTGNDLTNTDLIIWLTENGDVTMPETFTITTLMTNGSYRGATAIAENSIAVVTLAENSMFTLPSTISVSGASYTYNDITGDVKLSNPVDNVTITAVARADSSAPTVKSGISSYTWSELSEVAKYIGKAKTASLAAERAAAYNLAIGDTKTFTLAYDNQFAYDNGGTNGNYGMKARIVGFWHDTVSSSAQEEYGATKAGITFETTSLIPGKYLINSDGTENIGWSDCDLREVMSSVNFLAMFSMSRLFVSVDKKGVTNVGNSAITTTSDKQCIRRNAI